LFVAITFITCRKNTKWKWSVLW